MFSLLLVLLVGIVPQATRMPSQNQVIEEVRFTNNHRTRTDTLQYQVHTRVGETLNQDTIQRDVRAIFALGSIDDVKVYTQNGTKGVIVTFWIQERPYIRQIEYHGLKSVTQSEIVDKLRDKKVSLNQQTPYDEHRVRQAATLIKALLAEKGRTDAKVVVSTETTPTNDIIVTFNIDEGPKIRIQKIEFEGNTVFSQGQLRGAMKLVKEASPMTVFTGADKYHEGKLADDLTRIRMLYDNNGYLRINVLDPELQIKPTTLHRTLPFIKLPFPYGIPLPFWEKQVDRFYIKIKLEENNQYRIGKVSVAGAKVIPLSTIQGELGLAEGQVYNGGAFRKNLETLKKMYGEKGYVNFTAEPLLDFDEAKKLVNIKVDINEDRQFYVHRIAFLGNTTTRDNVIRRELLINEGDVFNSRAWDLSILRLNQLGYFELIGQGDAEVKTDPTEPQVDVTLRVKEKGRQTINFNGGASGVGGTFVGINYETNNFLGYGESMQVTAEGGTRQSNFVFSFNEPYLLQRPLSAGFSVYARTFKYDQSSQILPVNPVNLPTGLGLESPLNYQEDRRGFSVYSSYPVKLFQRFGLTYQLENIRTTAINPATHDFFAAVGLLERASFITSGGAFGAFRARKITPTYTWSTVDNPIQPSKGRSVTGTFEYTGGPLGGNIDFFRPTVEFRYFRPSTRRRNVIALRMMSSYLRGFNGLGPPFYERFFMGGDFDIRGFDFRAITPMSFLTRTVTTVDQLGNPANQLFDDIAYVGGDTEAVANFEYRIPLVGPITMVPFLDAGNTWVTNKSVLTRQVVGPNGQIDIEAIQFLPGTNSGLRASTGIEFQVVLPIINAPFRMIFAYNPLRINQTFFGPTTGLPFAIREPNHAVKFTIGRTF
jgi:outer membrane protein insertion porin family